MRKRTIGYILNKSLWHFLMVLPLILLIMSYIKISDTGNLFFGNIFESLGFDCSIYENYISVDNNLIIAGGYDISFNLPADSSLDYIIYQLTDYLLPNNSNYFIPQYLAYMIRIEFLHIAVDFILLLPRICTQLIGKISGGDYED